MRNTCKSVAKHRMTSAAANETVPRSGHLFPIISCTPSAPRYSATSHASLPKSPFASRRISTVNVPLDVVKRQKSITRAIMSRIIPGISPRVERFFLLGFLKAGGRLGFFAAAPRFAPGILSCAGCSAVVFFFDFAVAIASSRMN